MIIELMKRLRQQGVKLWLQDGALKFKSYQSAPIAPEDLASLKQHKPDVIQWLQQDQQHANTSDSPAFFDYFPLSENQKSLWLVYQLNPQSPAYNLTHCVELNRNIDIAKLEQAYQQLLARHGILRTAYSDNAGEPLQTLVSSHKLAGIACIPISVSTATSDPNHLKTLVKQQADEPFNLSKGEVCRAQLLTNEAANTVHFQLTLHHIAADFWSCEVVFAELLAIYGKLVSDPDQSNIPKTPEQEPNDYFQWSVQQQQWLQSEHGKKAADFWHKQLANHPTTLDIPGDFPRPTIQSFNGNMISFQLPATLSSNIRACAKALGVTPFVVGLAVWQVLLYRFSNQQTFTVGTPTSGRLEQEYQRTVGYLVNPVVLTCHCNPNATFSELVEQVKLASRDALSHQQYPLSKVMENLQQSSQNSTSLSNPSSKPLNKPLRDPSRNPLFQHLFALTHVQTKLQSPQHQEFVAQTLLSEQRGAAVDLGLILLDDRQSFTGELRYNSDIYSQSSANTFIDSYQTLLAAVCEEVITQPEKHQTLGELPVMSQHALQQIMSAGSPAPVAYPNNTCIHQLIEQQAQQNPEALALKQHQNKASQTAQTTSYEQLNQRANQLAHYLVEIPRVQPDQRIGILQHRSIDMIISILAVLKAGAAFVPLDPDLPADRIHYICNDADIQCFISTTQLAESLSPKNSDHIVCIDDNGFSRELNRYSTANIQPAQIELNPRHLAYVLYTSGSTGQPKGVMIEHQVLVNQTCWINNTWPSELNDRFLLKTPFNFDVSLSELFWPLTTGKPLIVTQPQGHKDPVYLSQVIRDENISKTHFVPTLLASLLANSQARDNLRQSQSLTNVYCAGEALSAALAGEFFDTCPKVKLHNLYGPTETTIFATGCEITRVTKAQQLPIGSAVQNLQTWVLDDNLNPVAPGMEGELYLSGAGLARGYLNLPELTQERFIDTQSAHNSGLNIHPILKEQRLYKTGDRVRWLPVASSDCVPLQNNASHTLQYLGRTDSQIKLRGLRIELGEIENALLKHADALNSIKITQACVLAENNDTLLACLVWETPHSLTGQSLTKEVLTEQKQTDLLNALRQQLARQLPDYMIPNAWAILDNFPLLPSGKTDRNALVKQAQSVGILDTLKASYVAPETDMEKIICHAWQTVLQVEQVGTNDNFFALGGNSLSATKAVAIIQEQIQIQENIQLDVPLKVWFEHPEVGALAATLSNMISDAAQQHSGVSDLDRMDSLLDELGV